MELFRVADILGETADVTATSLRHNEEGTKSADRYVADREADLEHGRTVLKVLEQKGGLADDLDEFGSLLRELEHQVDRWSADSPAGPQDVD